MGSRQRVSQTATALGLVALLGGFMLPTAQAREVGLPPQLVIGEPTGVIYRTVGADGRVSFSDQPAAGLNPGAGASRAGSGAGQASQDVIRIPTNRAETEARARAEREYWRKQADGFAARQRDRDREAELQRRERIAAAEREARTLIVPVGVPVRGGPWWFNGQPGVGNNPPVGVLGNGAGAYTSSPGAASGSGPASFIGSGFSSAGSSALR
jgi:hypothetical protein